MQQRIWIGVAAVAIVLIAVTVFWRYRPAPSEPAPPPPVVQAPPPRPADAPLPPAKESDARIRSLLALVSPQLREWLSQPDLLDLWVVVTDNLALDASPRKQLPFLAPKARFKALEKGGRAALDPKSYQRYDFIGGAVASVDARAFASAVRELHPWLQAAYHKLGYPERSFDSALQAALQRLIDAPVAESPPALKSKGAIWLFADENLESAGAVEKHLLRMGPSNTRRIQTKAREIATALDLRLAAH
jgi:DUF3014 family protein